MTDISHYNYRKRNSEGQETLLFEHDEWWM